MSSKFAGLSNNSSPSARFQWKKVMVSRGAAGNKTAGRKAVRWRRFGRRDPTLPITVRLTFKGGAEAWVLVDGRGEANVYPGYVALIDVLLDINQCR